MKHILSIDLLPYSPQMSIGNPQNDIFTYFGQFWRKKIIGKIIGFQKLLSFFIGWAGQDGGRCMCQIKANSGLNCWYVYFWVDFSGSWVLHEYGRRNVKHRDNGQFLKLGTTTTKGSTINQLGGRGADFCKWIFFRQPSGRKFSYFLTFFRHCRFLFSRFCQTPHND